MTRFLLLFLIIVVSDISCQLNTGTSSKTVAGKDSTITDGGDSIKKSDIWTEYSFNERQGREIFNKYCVVCHGQQGMGDGFNSFNLSPGPKSLADSAYNKALSNESIIKVIALGGQSMNRSVLMPAYQNTLSDTEIQYLLHYIRTFVRKSINTK